MSAEWIIHFSEMGSFVLCIVTLTDLFIALKSHTAFNTCIEQNQRNNFKHKDYLIKNKDINLRWITIEIIRGKNDIVRFQREYQINILTYILLWNVFILFTLNKNFKYIYF